LGDMGKGGNKLYQAVKSGGTPILCCYTKL
jgi:hypothetical protein